MRLKPYKLESYKSLDKFSQSVDHHDRLQQFCSTHLQEDKYSDQIQLNLLLTHFYFYLLLKVDHSLFILEVLADF